jgi:hypothetical protein
MNITAISLTGLAWQFLHQWRFFMALQALQYSLNLTDIAELT